MPRKIDNHIERVHMYDSGSARECSLRLGAVNKLIKQKTETGTVGVKRKGKCGKKRNTRSWNETILMRNSKLNPRKISYNLQQDFEKAGVIFKTQQFVGNS